MTKQFTLRPQTSTASMSTPSDPTDLPTNQAPQTTTAHSTSSTIDPSTYTAPFLTFMTTNPTTFHVVSHYSTRLTRAGYTYLPPRTLWASHLHAGGKYFTTRNNSSILAFTIGSAYTPGSGVAIIAAHIDALTAKLKPVSAKPDKAGFVQLGVAQYAGALNQTWWDRDLGIGGRVFVRGREGKVEERLVRLGWPVARIPSIAPHFGIPAEGQANRETRMVPIVGLVSTVQGKGEEGWGELEGTFVATQPKGLVKAIAGEIGVQDLGSIVNWELELFDAQPAQLGGLEKEFIFAGRLDDKLCSYAAMEALMLSETEGSGVVRMVGLFDDEEIGSLTRQGARGNFLPQTVERIVEALADGKGSVDLMAKTCANSFLVSADNAQAVNPNYEDVYLSGHEPLLNVGVAVAADGSARMTTDGYSTAFLQRVAEKSGSKLQVFQIRNDSRSGGTIGPMLSAAMGMRAIDAGIPQLSMHSIRATTGSLDPGLGVKLFAGFFEHFEAVDKEFD